MRPTMNDYRRWAGLAAVLLVLSGCGSGDSAVATDPTAVREASLSGRIEVIDVVSRRTGQIMAIDAASQASRPLVTPNPRPGFDDRYDSGAKFLPPSAVGESDFLFGVNDCQNGPTVLSRDSGCVDRASPDGRIQRLFEVDRHMSVSPSMSPDGSRIATVLSPGQIDGPFLLTLLSPAGEVLEDAPIAVRVIDADVSNIAWTADSRMVLAIRFRDRATLILMTKPNSLAFEREYLVSDTGSIVVRRISLDTTGTRLAYDTFPENALEPGTYKRSFVLDLATGTSTSVAIDNGMDVWAPEWSPDGRYLLVNHSLGGTTSDALLLPYQMLVRWEGLPVAIDAYKGVGSIFTVNNDALEDKPTRERWVFDPLKIWRP